MTDPSAEYLLERLRVIETRVRHAVAARRAADPDPDDAFRGLYVTDEHVNRLLSTGPLAGAGQSAAVDPAADLLSAAERSADSANGDPLRLRVLAEEFGLSGFEVDVLLVALAPDLDPRFEKLYGYLHDDVTRRRASVGLATELAASTPLNQYARSRFDPGAPLLRDGLLRVEDADRPFLTRALRVPDRVTAHLLGSAELDAGLRAVLRRPPPVPAPEGEQLLRALEAGVRLVYCRQPAGLWCASMVLGALAGHDRDALLVDLSTRPAAEAGELLRTAVREARLLGRVLVAGPVDDLDRSVVRAATAGGAWLVLYGAMPWDPAWSDAGVLNLDLHHLARRPAVELWTGALGPAGLAGAGGARPEDLAAFRLSPDQVHRAVAAARAAVAADGGGAPTQQHLIAGARLQNGTGLGRLARRVEPAVSWEDLVLPASTLPGLRHLTDRVRWRDRVLGEWRLRRAGGRGEGVTALFAGEPGTGKTMAAEVVAGALGLDLYVIDLSTVVDKYVGETEKNLERVFTGAEGVNGVLFFDEADALFGKRSEVSDARDRYANLEVAYLLQRMESFDGLAILATNLRSNLDDAFARRLSLIVEFARPDVAERRVLWQQSLAAVPLADDVDLDFCAAAFDLAGGDIRNIAVTTAYLAATAGEIVDMRRVIAAVRLEYRKLGRLCVAAEFGPYYPLLNGVP
ncbi:MAG TPA: ATP-binding protein [Micromonosporaceae bacterium]|nr:ATP-binding protein [Micromonosporaceae bacterium]